MGGLYSSLGSCRALLATARVGVSLPLPGTMARDTLFGWLAVEESTLRENCAGVFRRCAVEMPPGVVPDSVDPVTWAGGILRSVEDLTREQNPEAAWSWLESDFRFSSLLAPVEAWIAGAVAREARFPHEVVPVLESAYRNRAEIRGSAKLKEGLLIDIAKSAGFPAASRVGAVAERILGIHVPESSLYEPSHLNRTGSEFH